MTKNPRRKIWLLTALIGGVFSSAVGASLTDSLTHERLADLGLDKGWVASENGALLDCMARERLSQVELYGAWEQGDLIDPDGAEEELLGGLRAESYLRVSERVALYGRVGYSHFFGQEMAGSYWIDPDNAPFDLVEYTEENRGEKHLERFVVAGAAAYRPLDWFTLGASFDYQTANYTKRKDLRHTNSLMDMTLTLGLKFRLSNRLQLGANYTYRRRNESLLLSTYGTTDRTYSSLLSYGALFGKEEFFGDMGYTKEDEAKPLFDRYHGGAVQLLWRLSERLEWFSEAGYRGRKGYYGEPSPQTVVYANHRGSELFYKGHWSLLGEQNRHTLSLEWRRRKVENREQLYRFYNEAGGVSYVEYLGEVLTGNRRDENLSACYTFRRGFVGGIPSWQLAVEGSFTKRTTWANNYPDFRYQAIRWWRVEADAERNLWWQRNLFTFALGLGYGAGGGAPFEDGRYGGNSESQTLTRTLDERLLREYDFLTAPQIEAALRLGYARRIGAGGVRGYVELAYRFREALDAPRLGSACRHGLELHVGCKF